MYVSLFTSCVSTPNQESTYRKAFYLIQFLQEHATHFHSSPLPPLGIPMEG